VEEAVWASSHRGRECAEKKGGQVGGEGPEERWSVGRVCIVASPVVVVVENCACSGSEATRPEVYS
jgi:hypothetical protein